MSDLLGCTSAPLNLCCPPRCQSFRPAPPDLPSVTSIPAQTHRTARGAVFRLSRGSPVCGLRRVPVTEAGPAGSLLPRPIADPPPWCLWPSVRARTAAPLISRPGGPWWLNSGNFLLVRQQRAFRSGFSCPGAATDLPCPHSLNLALFRTPFLPKDTNAAHFVVFRLAFLCAKSLSPLNA